MTGGGRFARGGMDMNHFERTSQAYFAKADLTSQVARNHLVKLGAEVRIDRLDFTAFSLIPATDARATSSSPSSRPSRPRRPRSTSTTRTFRRSRPAPTCRTRSNSRTSS
ncbi:hypothetical protein [Rhodothermus marinus]|uniref:hypothetical protein n=1 Tax=Rhodothermus marinus TaxID=29549 RepID=UPI000A4A184B|nr:hypothetical protein [Rhodothermus marinus]